MFICRNTLVDLYDVFWSSSKKDYAKIDVSLKNTLLVLDIDETIIKFPNINQKWWDDNYGEQYKIHEIKKARDIVLKKWINIINKFCFHWGSKLRPPDKW